MRRSIGIDRKIKRAWLDAVLDRLSQTTDPAALRGFLDEGLKGELPGKDSRAKSVGICAADLERHSRRADPAAGPCDRAPARDLAARSGSGCTGA